MLFHHYYESSTQFTSGEELSLLYSLFWLADGVGLHRSHHWLHSISVFTQPQHSVKVTVLVCDRSNLEANNFSHFTCMFHDHDSIRHTDIVSFKKHKTSAIGYPISFGFATRPSVFSGRAMHCAVLSKICRLVGFRARSSKRFPAQMWKVWYRLEFNLAFLHHYLSNSMCIPKIQIMPSPIW